MFSRKVIIYIQKMVLSYNLEMNFLIKIYYFIQYTLPSYKLLYEIIVLLCLLIALLYNSVIKKIAQTYFKLNVRAIGTSKSIFSVIESVMLKYVNCTSSGRIIFFVKNFFNVLRPVRRMQSFTEFINFKISFELKNYL